MSNQSFRAMLYPGATTRLIGHTMVWHNGKHTVDPTRKEGYVSNDPVAVAAQCKNLKLAGFDVLMYNWYGPGNYEDSCTKVYFANSPLNHIINIDGSIVKSLDALLTLMTYVRVSYLGNPQYEKWNGKPIVTVFNKAGDQRSWFAALELANPDIAFVYTDPNMGVNQMAWVQSDLEANADWWIRTYGLRKGSLNIPCVSAGFNDLNSLTGHGVWGANPARIWPAGSPGPGPNETTLLAFFSKVNAHYSVDNQLPYLQAVTVNDADEGTNMLKRGFIVPPIQAPVYHLEAWLDGVKLGSLPLTGSNQKLSLNYVDQHEQVNKSTILEVKP